MDARLQSSEAASLTDLFCDGDIGSAAPDYSAVASDSSAVVCRGAWNPTVQAHAAASAILATAAAANANATNDDLSGLNTWDFAVMRSEFGDLQNIDSAALISLYRPDGAAASPNAAPMMGIDDSIVDLDGADEGTPRSRSDSGYSTSTLGAACAGQVGTWDACGRSWDCGSPVLSSSCSSSCHGGWSPPHHHRAANATTTATSGSRAAAQSRRSNSQRSRTNAPAAAAAAASGAGTEAERKPARKPRARLTKTRQLQLWQFLYHQLQLQEAWAASSSSGAPLRWESRHEGTFRIANPTALADAWGAHRRRSNMTYEKMSRTLRYYYDRKLITKVAGKQHTYRFHFDQFPDL